MKISVVIITKNEEKVLADCIKSVSFADEVLVIDSHSTDATGEIAISLGAKVISNPWEGYGKQKNVGMKQTRNAWVLFLDADERVSPELQSAIEGMDENTHPDVYWITVQDIFLGRKMKHLQGHNPRLVRKGAAQWSSKRVHEQLLYLPSKMPVKYKDGIAGELEAPIIHQSYATIAAYLNKMHMYTTLDAEDMRHTGTHRSGRPVTKSFILPYALAFRQAVKLLFYRKGILDSWQGIVWSMLSAYYEFEMGKKYLSL